MKLLRVVTNVVVLFGLIFLIACRFDPFAGRLDDEAAPPVSATLPGGFTQEEIQQFVDDIKSGKADLPVSLEVPAYSFYRFDYANAAGGHRGSTILSYDEAIASPSYGVKSTARVLIYEAMKARTGYSFDYFSFAGTLTEEQVAPVATALAAQYSDSEFLLNSPVNIGSTTLVAGVVNTLVGGLPLPPPADFTPVPIASPAVDLDLKPDFSDLPVTTLATLLVNEDLQEMYASMTAVGLANYSLFKSSVPAESVPLPSFRLHYGDGQNHNITKTYRVALAPVSGTASVTVAIASLTGVASPQLELSPSGADQKIVFTYAGDRAVSQVLKGTGTQLNLNFTYRDYLEKHSCERSKDKTEGPIAYLDGWEMSGIDLSGPGSATPALELLCAVVVDNLTIATFTARKGEPATVVLPIPSDRAGTLTCYIAPPNRAAAETSAHATIVTQLASGQRDLNALETAAWNTVLEASVTVTLVDPPRSISVPSLFQTWFRPQGSYVYQTSLGEFTPQVFRGLAAPTSPAIVLDMSGYSEAPLPVYSLPLVLYPVLSGIASGAFNTDATFTIVTGSGASFSYSLDGGSTWKAYSGPVTLSAEGAYRVMARNDGNGLTSPVIPVTIDRTAPLAPTISGISSGAVALNASFTVIAAEAGGTLFYSLDDGVTPATYTAPVILTENLKTYKIVAWQKDAAGNVGARSATLTVMTGQPPVVTGVSPASGTNNLPLTGVQITGSGFVASSVPRLTAAGQTPVTGTSVVVAGGTTLTCTFNLSGLVPGTWNVEVTNPDGQIATGAGLFTVRWPTLAVTAVSPTSGANNAVVTGVQITGSGFGTGAVPRLTRTGQSPVTGSAVTIAGAGTLACSFDLTGLSAGAWNVEVSYPNGPTGTGTNLFTVRDKNWNLRFGGSGEESAVYPVSTTDGGFLLAGTTASTNGNVSGAKGGEDVWIAKVDAYGTLLWSKCIGGSGADRCFGLIAITGGYALAGDTTSSDGDLTGVQLSVYNVQEGTRTVATRSGSTRYAWICCLDANGGITQQRLYGTKFQEATAVTKESDARGLKATADGGFIFAGSVDDGSYVNAWGVKLSSALAHQWETRLTANSGPAYALGVTTKTNGSMEYYLLCGYTTLIAGSFSTNGSSAAHEGFVTELNDTGGVVTTKCYGGNGNDYCTSVMATSDNGYCFVGTTGSTNGTCPTTGGGSDVMVVKVDANNGVTWAKSCGGAGEDVGVQGVLLSTGEVLFLGKTASTGGDVVGNHSSATDFWFGKVTSGGSLDWKKCYGGTADEVPTSLITTTDGGFLLGGYGSSADGDFAGTGSQGLNDFLLIRSLTLPTL